MHTRTHTIANPCKSFDGSTLKILVYIPNLIGYWRLFLVFYAFHELVTSHPRYFFALYLVIMALDFVDGLCARLLNQCSIFGAFLDVFVDIVARSLLWCHVTPQYAGWIIALEWYVCWLYLMFLLMYRCSLHCKMSVRPMTIPVFELSSCNTLIVAIMICIPHTAAGAALCVHTRNTATRITGRPSLPRLPR